jgi:outer membrane beta-barrel protein
MTALPALARAEALLPRDEGFMKEPKSVAYRRFKLDGANDLGVFGAFSIKNRLTEHYGLALTYDRQFNEYLALDLLAEGGYGGLTSLTRNIRDTAAARGPSAAPSDDLADAGALLATAQVGVRFTPIYGKMNLSSELPVHFNFYFNAGAGVALVNFNGILACASDLGSSKKCPGDFRSEVRPTLGMNIGGGLRFWIDNFISARIEVRDIVFLDRYYENVNMKAPKSEPGTVNMTTLSQTPLILVGVGFLL